MNIYWIIIISIACHLIMAIYACLLVKDSFKLPLKVKRSLMVFSFLVPFIGSALAITLCGNRRKSNDNNISVFNGGEQIGSSGCDGGSGGE